ncbi:hypothetical protein K2X30_10740 [bacterium]|nr:hypothetical protein [bacterium]
MLKKDSSLLNWVWFFGTALAVVFISVPHLGFFGIGRNLFIDEVVNIDAAVSFFQRGWITNRSSTKAFDEWISSGLLTSVFPALGTLVSGSYKWGRLISVFQNALALSSVAWLLSFLTRERATQLAFLGLVLLIPALPASLIYSQGEFLSFTCLVWGLYFYSVRKRFWVSSLFFALAVHFKLIAIVDIAGGLFLLGVFQAKDARNLKWVRPYFVNSLKAVAGIPLLFAVSQLYQFLWLSSVQEYLDTARAFTGFFFSAGSGLNAPTSVSRWQKLTALSEFGAYQWRSKLIFVLISLIPIAALWKSKNQKLKQNDPIFLFVLGLAGASIFHLLWWYFKSDQIWIRHGFIGLFVACACGALVLPLEKFRRYLPQLRIVMLLICVGIVLMKFRSGYKEFYGRPIGCEADVMQFQFCDAKNPSLEFHPYRFDSK